MGKNCDIFFREGVPLNLNEETKPITPRQKQQGNPVKKKKKNLCPFETLSLSKYSN